MKTEKSKQQPETAAAAKKSARAVVKYLRISPRKARLVIDTMRFEPVDRAFSILSILNKKAARMTEKLLKSAVANAKVLGMNESLLYVADIRADGGPSMKRVMSRSMGRADKIIKRMTHLSIILKEQEGRGPASAPAVETEEAQSGGQSVKKFFSRKKKAATAGKSASA